MSAPREKLLQDVIAFVAEEGLTDLSLRQIADGVGTSHRMLLYHFKSRAGLVAAIAAEVESRQREAMASLTRTDVTPREWVLASWKQVSTPELAPFVALFFDVMSQAIQRRPGTEDFRANLTEPWIEAAREAGRHAGVESSDADIRLGIAAVRGLLLDLQTGGDPAEVGAAIERLATLLSAET